MILFNNKNDIIFQLIISFLSTNIQHAHFLFDKYFKFTVIHRNFFLHCDI